MKKSALFLGVVLAVAIVLLETLVYYSFPQVTVTVALKVRFVGLTPPVLNGTLYLSRDNNFTFILGGGGTFFDDLTFFSCSCLRTYKIDSITVNSSLASTDDFSISP